MKSIICNNCGKKLDVDDNINISSCPSCGKSFNPPLSEGYFLHNKIVNSYNLIWALISFILMILAIFFFFKCRSHPMGVNNVYQIRIDDEADVFSEKEERRLKHNLIKCAKYTNIAIVTLNNNKLTPEEYGQQYSNSFFDKNGIVYLIDFDNKEVFLNVDGITSTQISSSDIDKVLDFSTPFLEKNKFYKGTKVTFRKIFHLLDWRMNNLFYYLLLN